MEETYSTSYSMEELTSVVVYLAKRYTSNESNSISYDMARHFMMAASYCIQEYEDWYFEDDYAGDDENRGDGCKHSIQNSQKIDVLEAYKKGYNLLLIKGKRLNKLYETMLSTFDSYGVRIYEDVFRRGIPGFIKKYDAIYSPHETILTMDYPTIMSLNDKTGMDAIYDYLRFIYIEQQFLKMFSREYVIGYLETYSPAYKGLFINPCEVLLEQVLPSMLSDEDDEGIAADETAGGQAKEGIAEENSLTMKLTRKEYESGLSNMLRLLIANRRLKNDNVSVDEYTNYLGACIKNIAAYIYKGDNE